MVILKLINQYKIILILFFSIILSSNIFAQNTQIDSLLTKAEKLTNTTDKMIGFAREAYQLSLNKKYKHGEAQSLKLLGIYEHSKSNFPAALNFYNKALAIFETNKNNLEIAKTTLSIAIVYSNTNDHGNSVKYGMKALKIFEDLKDLKGKSKVINILGISFAKEGDFKIAKNYFLQYNAISKKNTDTVDLAYSYNNLGGINRDLKILDSALYYFKIASKLFTKKNFLPGIALADKNIGSVYADRNEFKQALVYAKKSLQASLIAGDKRTSCIVYRDLGFFYKELKDTANAYLYLNKAISLAKLIDEKETIYDVSKILADLDKGKSDFKSAYENLVVSKDAYESLVNTEKTTMLNDLTTKYETEKKEEKIKNLNQESTIQKLQLKQKNAIIWIVISVLSLSLVLGYLIFSRRKFKARAVLQFEINKQQDIAARAVLDAEERERRRIAGDLHDGVGQMLSAALMNMNSLYKKLNLTTDEDLQAKKTLALVNESYDEMRTISHQMMPNALIKSGLASAVKEFLNKLDKDIIKINLETIGLKNRINEQTETVLYRVIQETVNNVIKHADANKLHIVLIKDEEGVSVTIEDNGKGFDKSKIKKDGIGISNIYSRVAFLKGTVDIDTAPGKGTLIAIHIPD